MNTPKTLKKKHQNFSVRQRFTYIFIRCHCWLKRQGVTAPLVRLKIKNLSLFDTSSKFFFSLERKTKAQQQLLSVQSPEGGIVSEPKMIKRIVVDYFSSLFCAKKIDLNVAKAFI